MVPLPYIDVSYGPPMWSLIMSYMTIMVPHTLYGIGIL